MKRITLTIGLLAALGGAQASEVEVTMQNKSFSTKTVTLKPGDKIVFRNADPFVHNIFSLTEPGSFDLGTYPQGQARDATFKDEGVHEVECAIHPEMKLSVNVKK